MAGSCDYRIVLLTAVVCGGLIASPISAELSQTRDDVFGTGWIIETLDAIYFDGEPTFMPDPVVGNARYAGGGLVATRVDDFGIGGVLDAINGQPGDADDQQWQVEFVKASAVFRESGLHLEFGYDLGDGNGFVQLLGYDGYPGYSSSVETFAPGTTVTWGIADFDYHHGDYNWHRWSVPSLNDYQEDALITFRIEGLDECGAVWLLMWEDTPYPVPNYCPGFDFCPFPYDGDYNDIVVQIVATSGVDTDGDGISDACDQCNEDFGCANLDINGCPTGEDGDTDGVVDGCDACPETPQDVVTVEADGCADYTGDSDNDSVLNAYDACPDTTNALFGIDDQGCAIRVPGDMDLDFDVDQTDFGLLQACMTGEGIVVTDPACEIADLDDGSDVDSYDAILLKSCMTGNNIIGDPDCLTSP